MDKRVATLVAGVLAVGLLGVAAWRNLPIELLAQGALGVPDGPLESPAEAEARLGARVPDKPARAALVLPEEVETGPD